MFILPGYKSVSDFSREQDVPYMTVVNQLKRGYCKFPRRQIDGNSSNPAYKCWENMIQRCTNPKSTGYEIYGGRGISIHPLFLDFKKFINHIGPRPSKRHSIDRINVDGNYEPGNVRWATAEEQAQNKRYIPLTQPEKLKHGRWYRFRFRGVCYKYATVEEAITSREEMYTLAG